jgi:phage terminase large subunit
MFFASMVVERCLMNSASRIVCIREYQRSLAQSVKLLIEDKIEQFGVASRFHNTRDRIEVLDRGGIPQGLIIFQGMQNHTAETIKSLEGFDVAYVEEAQSLSMRSFTMLRPTIRKSKSELWFAYNPRSMDDPVDVFFRTGATDRTDTIFVHANYNNNPWFPDDLRADMEYDKRRDPERYAHVWLGKYQQHSEARVFHNWRVGDEHEFSSDPKTRYHFGADWGFAKDPTVLIRCYTKGRTLYVDREAYAIGCEIDRTPALFDQLENGQARKWRIIADSARPETISYMSKHGYPRMVPAKKGKGSVEDGVEFLKSYDVVVHPQCRHTIDELTTYSYKVDRQTEEVLPILQDDKNHVIDALRYAVESLRTGSYDSSLSWVE